MMKTSDFYRSAPRVRPAPRILAAVAVASLGLVGAAWAGGPDDDWVELEPTAAPAAVAGAKGSAPRRYVVVDRANNRLLVYQRGEVLLDAVVSTGSGAVLDEVGGEGRRWVFDTPPGRFSVLRERPNPVWTKPDWAFLEEGRPVPTDWSERVERGSLGEWALDLGDGYMIHGTLYERLLGRSLTHGCIRVGRDDLRILADLVGPGTPVYIF